MWYVSIAGKYKKARAIIYNINTYPNYDSISAKNQVPRFIHFFLAYCQKYIEHKQYGAISKCWNSEEKGVEFLYIHICIYSIYIYRYTHEILLPLLVDL